MLIQKKFHLAMEREAARTLLLDLRSYRSAVIGLEQCRLGESGLMELQFRLPWGFLARIHLAREWGEDEEQILFRSHGGNVVLYGSVDFITLKRGVTEVLLIMEYRIASPMHRMIDLYRHGVDTLVEMQINAIEAHFARRGQGFPADRNLPSPMNGHSREEEEL